MSPSTSHSHSRPGHSRRVVLRGMLALAGGMLLPFTARGQESPPIQPDDGTPVSETPVDQSDQIIEPQVQPTIAPDQDSALVLEQVDESIGRYFPATGHNLSAPFLAAWELAGGEEVIGPPLSEPRYSESDGGIRQDFAGLALLHRPDQGTLGGTAIPTTKLRSIDPAAGQAGPGVCTASSSSCVVVGSQGHTISGAIANFWNLHGGAQILGEPQGEALIRGGDTIQVFANAVVRQHGGGEVTIDPVNAEVVSQLMASDEAFRPTPPTNGKTWLIRADGGLNLRSGPFGDAEVIATVPDNAEFIAAPHDTGAWVGGYVDGFAGWVSRDFLTERPDPPAEAASSWRLDVWTGSALGETNVRRAPSTTSPSLRTIEADAPLVVTGWVRGEAVVENQITWAQLEGGGYVYARNLRRSAPVSPPPLFADAPQSGKWIDVHLTQQLMVAYEGRIPVRTVVTTTGMPGWETPPGWYAINHRVANETMESGSIGAENFYVLKDVLFTQYFTDRGHALHYAWWKNAETIGRPGSHGCLNLLLADARFFWDWATIGTPVICRTENSW